MVVARFVFKTMVWLVVLIGMNACGGQSCSEQPTLQESAAVEEYALGHKCPTVPSLREHVGTEERVDLDVYFIGFPKEMKRQLRAGIREELGNLSIKDAKPWWIPNMPRYGADEFALAPAPADLPPELTPPDGMIRYDAVSLSGFEDPITGQTVWLPNRELDELVDDWHRNVDTVYYVEHEGAYTGVEWRTGDVDVHFVGADKLGPLYAQLEQSRNRYDSSNPDVSFDLYSYSDLFDWIDEVSFIRERKGGASLVFLNLAPYGGTDYTFYAEPGKDLLPLTGIAPAELQFPPATATTPENQAAADLMTGVLGGGVGQAKMLAALELHCVVTATAAEAGLQIPGIKDDQPICAHWAYDPIPNLLGNDGRRFFVSDNTRELASYAAGQLSVEDLVSKVRANFFELYRYGVLQTSIKANNVYSEAYELRTLVVDLRYSQLDLCLLDKLQSGVDPAQAVADCTIEQVGYPTELTYQIDDVFDVELARASLQEFNPARWDINFVPLTFGLQPDGSINPIEAVQTKAFLRDFLNEPVLPNPVTGENVVIKHPPLYRELQLIMGDGSKVELTSSWEKGFDLLISTALLTGDPDTGGLGIYDLIWPDAKVVDDRPYHETGKAQVKPLALILTPDPDGPLNEKWGTFPINLQATAGLGIVTAFGGGSLWVAVGGNEQGGGFVRRDFLTVVPQYVLGKNHGSGSAEPLGVMPDGSVEPLALASLTAKALDIGAPHWCNEFNSEDARLREACRNFVRTTTTLQSIETLQHGLGYMHAPEPRKRYHYDGERSSIARIYELLQDPDDLVGFLLHQLVNQYTTAGVSTVWGQITSEWNGIGPSSGMQSSMFRSHAREEIAAAERNLQYAIDELLAGGTRDRVALRQILRGLKSLRKAIRDYDAWEYERAIERAVVAIERADKALTRLGEPDHIYSRDEQASQHLTEMSAVGLPLQQVRAILKPLDLPTYRQGAWIFGH